MTFQTEKPDYSSADTAEKLDRLIGYVEALSEELEFRLETITKSIQTVKLIKSGTNS